MLGHRSQTVSLVALLRHAHNQQLILTPKVAGEVALSTNHGHAP